MLFQPFDFEIRWVQVKASTILELSTLSKKKSIEALPGTRFRNKTDDPLLPKLSGGDEIVRWTDHSPFEPRSWEVERSKYPSKVYLGSGSHP